MADLDTSSEGHGKKKKGVRSKKVSTKIDMTPMVDLAFLLVTFFMLTTTFNKPNAMEVIMPEKPKPEDTASQTKVKASEALTVIVAQRNRIFYYKGISESPQVEQTDYSANGLRKVLLGFDSEVKGKQRAEGKKEVGPVVLIKAIDDAQFGHMVDVLDEMKITGMQRYAIVDITPEEKNMLPPVE